MIKINNLNKYFYHHKSNEIHVINDVSIEFPQTGLVTILGESGCGKTTLMNVIGGLDDFYNGSMEYDNLKINKYSSKKMDRIRNEKIGYIFQNYLLLHQRTVYDNLMILLNMYNISLEEKNERIDYVLEAVGMLKYKKKNVSELSGGQQQRVAIARALIKSPSVILADEPTGNLDEKNTIQIMNIIKKISETTLVILVSHEKSIATSYSDYLIEISDGKITNKINTNDKTTYHYEDDQNIYLKEFKYTNIKDDNINIDFYNNDNTNINIQIIYQNNKLYLKTNNDTILVDENSEIEIVDDYKKILNIEEEKQLNDFDLKQLQFVKSPSLSFKECIRLAMSNLSKMKKRIMFLSFPLLIIIVLTLFSTQSLVSGSIVDRQHITAMNSNIMNVTFEKGDAHVVTDAWTFGYYKFYQDFKEKNPNLKPVVVTNSELTFNLPDFTQLKNKRNKLSAYSIISVDYLSEEKLIYGRMPELPHEIVVDKWVLENTINETTLSNFMTVSTFLNMELYLKERDLVYKIVGISQTEENSIYMDNWNILNISTSYIKKNGYTICSYSQLEKYLEKKLDYDLGTSYCLQSKYSYEKEYKFDSKLKFTDQFNGFQKVEFNVMNRVDFGSCPYDYAIPDEAYEDILTSVLYYSNQTFNVYCQTEEEKQQVIEYVNEVSDYYKSGELKANPSFGFNEEVHYEDVVLNITATSKYDEYLQPYYQESQKIVTSRLLITIMIVLISIIIVYFSMKSYAIKNIYDIGVYRAIGISKRSITLVYAIEIFVISIKTTFVGGIITYLITNIIQGVPVFDLNIGISFDLFSVTTFALILINVIVGVLPIIRYLKLTPSKILTKYDI